MVIIQSASFRWWYLAQPDIILNGWPTDLSLQPTAVNVKEGDPVDPDCEKIVVDADQSPDVDDLPNGLVGPSGPDDQVPVATKKAVKADNKPVSKYIFNSLSWEAVDSALARWAGGLGSIPALGAEQSNVQFLDGIFSLLAQGGRKIFDQKLSQQQIFQ